MEIENPENSPSEKKFKPFNDTYVFCAFGLAIGLIYPNKTNFRKKLLILGIVLTINVFEIFWFFNYIITCILRGDLYNFMRNMSLVIISTLFFFKTIYVNVKNNEFSEFLNKMTTDLVKANEMEEEYQDIYTKHIKQAKAGEIVWIIIPLIFSAQFPLYATVGTIYESLKSDVGPRYMQHEMELKGLENKQYDTPYFEIVFAYNFLQCIALMPTFVGFDGSFCIATTHLRLKLKLMVHKMQKAFENSKSPIELREEIKQTIKAHQSAMEFYNDLQDVYGGWLFAVFLLTAGLISFNLYQIYLIKKFDLRYTIFVLSGIMHIYAPCYYASDLLEMSENLGTEIYCTPWEQVGDSVVTKLMIFMIVRAQQPLILTGKGIVIFNMQLFTSILQTSYSFFTLISS